jgi:magnesium transporter
MINVFVLHNGRLSQINIENRADLENTLPVWVDLTDPNEEEREWVKSIYGVTLPGEDEVKDIEASARYYEADSGDLHLRTDFLIDENEDDEPARTVTVAFILARDILFSVHNTDLPVFRLVRMRARSRPGSINDYKDVLLDLYATDAEYSADALEGIYQNLEDVSRAVLQKNSAIRTRCGAEFDRTRGRSERAYPPQYDGYAPCRQFSDARSFAECGSV